MITHRPGPLRSVFGHLLIPRLVKYLVFVFVVLPLALFSQKIYDLDRSYTVLEADPHARAQADYLLFVHSSHRCGYCRLLRRDMAQKHLPDNLRLVFMEYDTPEAWIVDADSTYRGAEVRRVSAEGHRENYKVKLFSTSQLVRARDSSVVKKYKGYPYDLWEDVFKRVRR